MAIGTRDFKTELLKRFGLDKITKRDGKIPRFDGFDLSEANELLWKQMLQSCLDELRRKNFQMTVNKKSALWLLLMK